MKSLLASFRSHLAFLFLIVLVTSGHAQSPFTGIVAGQVRGFFLRGDGTVWATGGAIYGEFGEGPNDSRPVPRPIALSGVVAIASGERFTLFLKSDGTVLASGSNSSGQFGNGTTDDSTVPVQVMTGVKAIAAGSAHSLFLKTDGSVWASGANFFGQLGDGTMDARSMAVQVMSGVKAMSAGDTHSLFLKTDGTVWATGSNGRGQFGNGTRNDETTPAQIFTGVAAISAGSGYSLFLKTDHSAWATGANSLGQLGAGTEQDELTPIQVLSGVAAISAGVNHSQFLKTDGTAWAAGFNQGGQLGDGSLSARISPVQVLAGVSAISAGAQNSFFIKRDGTVWATGANNQSQLGDGTLAMRTTPGQIIFETRMKAISAGGSHSFFLKANGGVWASGDNQYGQLGDGSTNSTNTPIEVLTGVKAVSAGRFHSLFIKEDGSAWSCGSNTYGQLGNGTTNSGATPNPVQVLNDVQAVSAGATHSLFLKTDGTVWACGENFYGQLGDGTRVDKSSPTQISLTDVKVVSAGTDHSLFLKNDGSAWAAGSNSDGQLGSGPNVSDYYKSTPVQVLAGVGTLDAGGSHSIFVKNDLSGSTYATGRNSNGEFGDNSTNPAFSPKLVFFGGVDVSAGGSHTMFMRTGAIFGTGFNYGALAIGNNDTQLKPVRTLTEGDQAVSAGQSHSLILTRGGNVFASGRNLAGQLGDGTQEQRPGPVEVTGLWIPEMVAIAPGGQTLNSGGTPISFGSVNRGSNQSITLTLKNGGYRALTGITPSFFGGNASDFSVVLAPLAEVSPEGTTTVTVRFTPAGNGARATTLRIASNDPDQGNFDIPLSGNGVGIPEITVFNGSTNLNDGNSASYGSVNRGSARIVSFTIRNTGTLNLTGIAASLSGGTVADYAIASAPASSLAPNANTMVSVRFTPGAAGVRTTTLRIASSDADENPFDIPLSGTGVSVPEIAISQGNAPLIDAASSVAFGSLDIGTNRIISLTLRNTGTSTLSGIAASLIGGSAVNYKITTAPPPFLAPNATATISIQFLPTAAGARNTQLRIASNDEDENLFDIALTGTGVPVPEIAVANGRANLIDGKSKVGFGSVRSGSSKVITLTIKNVGSAPLTKIAASLTGAQASQFKVSKPGASLAPGKSTTVKVTFSPKATGARSGTLKIASNDGDEKVFDIQLSGTAVAAAKSAPVAGVAASRNRSEVGKVSSLLQADGTRHRVLTVDKSASAGLTPLVEVSSDLVTWFSGPDHAVVLFDDAILLRVMDRTPHSPRAKRFIRVRWLRP